MKGDRFSVLRKVRQSEFIVLMLELEYHFPKRIPFVYVPRDKIARLTLKNEHYQAICHSLQSLLGLPKLNLKYVNLTRQLATSRAQSAHFRRIYRHRFSHLFPGCNPSTLPLCHLHYYYHSLLSSRFRYSSCS
jgi:hypothetical protein